MTPRPTLLAFALVSALACAPAALAGPPAICHPIEIGDAASLPFGNGAFDKKWLYDRDDLVKDTLAILKDQDDTLVHMETLRRAAIYVGKDRDLGVRLFAALQARVLDAEAAGAPSALAWFDAGYLAQCYDQNGLKLDLPCGTARGVAGYGWVRHALELAADHETQAAAMEFGAAIMTAMTDLPEFRKHAARAAELAADGTLVAQNVERHANRFWPGHSS